MKTFAERLNAAMSAADISQGQLADKVGISQPAIQKMTSGKTSGSRKMVELAHALGVRPEWLSSGVEMRIDGNVPSAAQPVSETIDVFRVDVLDLKVSAGQGLL